MFTSVVSERVVRQKTYFLSTRPTSRRIRPKEGKLASFYNKLLILYAYLFETFGDLIYKKGYY